MTIDSLLSDLSRARRCGAGWLACCPAHADRNPSLSIKEGERGILIKCWAGCTFDAVCISLGIRPRDLFFGHPTLSPTRRTAKGRPHSFEFNWREYSNELFYHAEGFFLRGERVLNAARNLDISQWTDEDLTQAMEAVCGAHSSLALANRLEDLAFDLRCDGLKKEQKL